MMTLGARWTLAPTLLGWLAVLAAVAAVAWEWVRGGFLTLRRPKGDGPDVQDPRLGRSGRRKCAAAAIVLAGPLAWVVWRMLAASVGWSWAILGACAVAWAVRGYRKTTADLPRRTKRRLVRLRLAVIVLLLLAAAHPALEEVRRQPVRMGLAILVDTSKSMAREDQAMPAAGASPAAAQSQPAMSMARLPAVQRALEAHRAAMRGLAGQYDLLLAGFDDSLHRDAPADLRPVGQATAIGDCVQRAMDDFLARGVAVAGVCVITDGCNNTTSVIAPQQQAEALAARGVALWAVGVGNDQPAGAVSLNIRNLQAPDQIDAMDRLSVRAEVAATALAGQTVEVRVQPGR